jgi:hypothetical protein
MSDDGLGGVIEAVLAELATRDRVAAGNAEAALEWMVGEQGLALLSQERVQDFCWYDLPLKWMNDLHEKLEVADALAQALEMASSRRRNSSLRRPGTTMPRLVTERGR